MAYVLKTGRQGRKKENNNNLASSVRMVLNETIMENNKQMSRCILCIWGREEEGEDAQNRRAKEKKKMRTLENK